MTIWSQSCPTWTKKHQEASSHSAQSLIYRPKILERKTYSTIDCCNIYHKREIWSHLTCDWHPLTLTVISFVWFWCFRWCCWTFNLQALLHQKTLYTALCVSLMSDDWSFVSVDILFTSSTLFSCSWAISIIRTWISMFFSHGN